MRGASPGALGDAADGAAGRGRDGAELSVVETTSWYSRGFGGPTLTKAVSLPSVRR